jgi:hypothetical protein
MGLINLPRLCSFASLEICVEYVPLAIARGADSTSARKIAEKKFRMGMNFHCAADCSNYHIYVNIYWISCE